MKIGIGGIIGNEIMTFDFATGERLAPYLSKILGRDFKYGFKREFVQKRYAPVKKVHYGGDEMHVIVWPLERHVAYEYKRFAGATKGEIEEGYFVILSDGIRVLEYDELRYWCGTAKEKEAHLKKLREQKQLSLLDEKKYAPDDVDF